MRHPARALCAPALAACTSFACLAAHAQATTAPTGMQHVAWSRNANIYEANIRQFSSGHSLPACAVACSSTP